MYSFFVKIIYEFLNLKDYNKIDFAINFTNIDHFL